MSNNEHSSHLSTSTVFHSADITDNPFAKEMPNTSLVEPSQTSQETVQDPLVQTLHEAQHVEAVLPQPKEEERAVAPRVEETSQVTPKVKEYRSKRKPNFIDRIKKSLDNLVQYVFDAVEGASY